MKLYLTGMLGYETARRLYEADRKRFEARFPRFFLDEFEKLSERTVTFSAFLDKLCIDKNTKTLYSRKKFFLHASLCVCEVTEGGLFGALWEVCEELDAGCSVRLLEIPLDQHVVEILEYAGENPYEVASCGCLLIAAEEDEMVGEMTEIGTVTDGNERVLLIGEKKRYLTPPERQAKDIEDRRGERHAAGNRKKRCE